MHAGYRVLLAAVLLVGAGAPLATAPAAAAPDDGTIHVDHAVELTPDSPNSVRVTATFSIPSQVLRVFATVPEGATVVGTDGFDGDDLGSFEWDGDTASPSITYEVDPASEATVGEGVDFADTGPWALVGASRIDVDFGYSTRGVDPGKSESFRVVGEGVAGTTIAYLGDADLLTHELTGQTLRLVVPNGSSVDTDRVTATLDNASSWLRVDDLAPSVTMFVAQDPIRRGGLVSPFSRKIRRSATISESGWVHESARFDVRSNTWIHEYVHTRQGYVTTDRMAWIDEGSASYYESLLTLYAGTGEFETFHSHVSTSQHADAVLLDQEGEGNAQYEKGMRVVAALDARIHAETNGKRTFQDVLARMNERDGEINYVEFTSIVNSVAGTQMDGWLDRYVAGDEVPTVPDDPLQFTPAAGTGGDTDGDGLDTDAEAAAGTHPFRADTDGDGIDDGREMETWTDPLVADTDGDGLEDGREIQIGTDPMAVDTDGDGLLDGQEIRIGTDPTVADMDDDGLGDGRETQIGTEPTVADTDGDGLEDGREIEIGTDPTVADTDGDGLDDPREVDGPTDPTVADTDGDGLEDGREMEIGADPTVADTDDDGLEDGREVEIGTDPTAVDTDGDGLDDAAEVDGPTDPTAADTDGDGLADGREIELGTDPTVADTDGDGLADGREVEVGTDPTVADSDDDGLEDGREMELGTDPLTADSDSDGLADGREIEVGSSPTVADSDGDGLLDGREVEVGTDPTARDSDGDGYTDGSEQAAGTDPTAETGFIEFWLARLF